MSNKSNSDKVYDKGYNDGKNGGFMDDFVHGNKNMVPLPKGKYEGSYDGGYADGAKDRNDSSNCHYQGGSGGGGSSNSGGCFLTTACTAYKGLPDNCSQLETLRKFRDGFVKNRPLGKELITEYYQKAPKVVLAIGGMDNETQAKIYERLFGSITLVCMLINAHKEKEAFKIYTATSRKLFDDFVVN